MISTYEILSIDWGKFNSSFADLIQDRKRPNFG